MRCEVRGCRADAEYRLPGRGDMAVCGDCLDGMTAAADYPLTVRLLPR